MGLPRPAWSDFTRGDSTARWLLLKYEGVADVVLQLDSGSWLRFGIRRVERHMVRIWRGSIAVIVLRRRVLRFERREVAAHYLSPTQSASSLHLSDVELGGDASNCRSARYSMSLASR